MIVFVLGTLLLASQMAWGARQVSFDEAWDISPVVVRGELTDFHWMGEPATDKRSGQVVYTVAVDEVWKGEAAQWIQVVEESCPGKPSCCAGVPRTIAPKSKVFLYLVADGVGQYRSAAWGSCGMIRLNTELERLNLQNKIPNGPTTPTPVHKPVPAQSEGGGRCQVAGGGPALVIPWLVVWYRRRSRTRAGSPPFRSWVSPPLPSSGFGEMETTTPAGRTVSARKSTAV
jgi:hypothetical protein